MHRAKAERITGVKNEISDRDEVQRRLPEIELIPDEQLQETLYQYFIEYCPQYFWENAASATGKYHPPDESGEHGTWLHTKRVFATYQRLADSYQELHLISDHELCAGLAAALIHDTFNYGWPSENRDYTSSEHDVIAAAVANFAAGFPEEVVRLVHSHMGPWGEGNIPVSDNEKLFHMADAASAQSNHTPSVHEPTSELQRIIDTDQRDVSVQLEQDEASLIEKEEING